MKYISAEKLITEINKRLMSVNLEKLGNFGSHRVWAYNDVIDLIISLQQEQPEVDLEEEIIRYQREDMDRDTTVGDVARHFWEKGYNTRKEE